MPIITVLSAVWRRQFLVNGDTGVPECPMSISRELLLCAMNNGVDLTSGKRFTKGLWAILQDMEIL